MPVLQTRTTSGSDSLALARRVLRAEARALTVVADRLDGTFQRVVDTMYRCQGRIAVTGVGKSADVGRKIVGTLNSTGTRSYFLDATGAMHGDIGGVHPDDAVLALTHSGESEELVRLLPRLRGVCAGVAVMTGREHSTAARFADLALIYGDVTETCPLRLAPSTSTTVMIALGDALAFALSRMRGLTAEQFARNHPAGNLGRKLAPVASGMRSGPQLRIASADETIRTVFGRTARMSRRTGAVMLIDSTGRLCGIFTDSDLARLFEKKQDERLDRPIRDVMTANPITISIEAQLGAAVEIMSRHKISELPVVDAAGRPVGMLDVTDLFDLMPAAQEPGSVAPAKRQSA